MKEGEIVILRPDLIFSNWIFVWYVLYILGIVKVNPLLPLLIALCVNIIHFSFLFFVKKENILSICIAVFILKVIPILTLIKSKDIMVSKCIIISCILLFLYLIWLIINQKLDILYYTFLETSVNYKLPLQYIIEKSLVYLRNSV